MLLFNVFISFHFMVSTILLVFNPIVSQCSLNLLMNETVVFLTDSLLDGIYLIKFMSSSLLKNSRPLFSNFSYSVIVDL